MSDAAFDEFNIRDPVSFAPGKACTLVFSVKGRRRLPEQGRAYAFKCVDANHRVGMAVNLAGDDRHDATPGADMELGGVRAKAVPGYERGVADSDTERAGVAGRPYAAVLRTKRAVASPRRDLIWLRLPSELERNVSAMTAAVDEHDDLRL
jgi:hypothetical protein